MLPNPFQHIALLGVGQMGASLAKALHAKAGCARITGYDAKAEQASSLVEAGVLTLCDTPSEAVQGADLVVFCVPMGAYGPLMSEIEPALKEGTIVTDIGSVKEYAVEVLEPHLNDHVFVPSHPIAGSERTGAATSSAGLFEGKLFFVTLQSEEPRKEDEQVLALWRALGADAQYLPLEMHDQIYALMSHVPQALAYVSAHQMRSLGVTGIDATTKRHLRISQSDPIMWRDVYMHNRENIVEMLDFYLHILGHIKHELLSGAKEGQQETSDVAMQPQAVLPYVLASSLVSTVTLYESKLELPLYPFAAGGFKDFTYAASGDPEPVMQAISAHAGDVAMWLESCEQMVRGLMQAIQSNNDNALLVELTLMQQSGKGLCNSSA